VERKDQQSKPISESPVGPELLLYDESDDDEQTAGHFPVVISTDSRSPSAQAQTHARPTHDHEHKPLEESDDGEALRRPFQARSIYLVSASHDSSYTVNIGLLLHIKQK
jgi:hypothetical protein